MRKFIYPPTRIVDQVDDYHGTLVADPYRWLEDNNSEEVNKWIENQNKLTFSFIHSIPGRETIKDRLKELWNYPRSYAPRPVSGKYFQLRNSGLQNQDVLYVSHALEGERLPLIDPNTFSEDGTQALVNWKVSRDGRKLAYSFSESGSDWQTWRIRDVDRLTDYPEVIRWSKFSSVAWLPDGSGFFYCRYDHPSDESSLTAINQNQRIYFHRIGTSQSEDKLIYERPDQPEWGFDLEISQDGIYIIMHVWQGTDTRNRLFYKNLDEDDNFIELIPELEAAYRYIGNDGPVLYIQTDYQAKKGQVIAIDLRAPTKREWRTLIPEGQDTLEFVKLIANQFICVYLHHAHHIIQRFDLDGTYLGDIPLPDIGSIFNSNLELHLYGERDDSEMYFTFHSFTVPPTPYRYSFTDDKCQPLEIPSIKFDVTPYKIEQIFLKSKDNTEIPLFLIFRKDLEKNGNNPTLLYGYGGFNISLTPVFQVQRLIWLEMGGMLAIANLRGGGEYGEDWHKAGSLENKQNVFDDMIACAEYLIENGYTTPKKLAIEGRSNGGLLVGACMTQRPDLFGAALPAVGVMDMLRFHKFTIGWAWVSEYGSSDDKRFFPILYAYSPLHHIKPNVKYPATLVTTGDHDDRVVPAHSFKFIAALQAAQAGDAPVLIRIQTNTGHGFGKPTSVLIEEQADIYAFLSEVLEVNLNFK